ncbi:MAG: BREX-1 system adenine-specific DNA-methyltransferase PglX [Deltaproteobacteria bacterium]|nr:BREX-1 system adenine-specific DNA-methyltransferase PglX [Deltaproteobacteria bacterium]MCL5792731.1 BREX-1 system adenine-specific DNA-methyltransferase PglX [Deltaproteobacteria bacterium]
MSKDTLNDIIEKFSPEGFVDFFRSKNRSFKPFTENLQQYNDDIFSDAFFVGEIPFDNVQKLGIYAFRVTKDLTERSSKKAQYEKGKKIIKETNSNAGIFIFYDANGNFRFSLIYPEYTGQQRQWSNFKRFTYFVSPSFTNKTFLKQIVDGDFLSIESIKQAFSVEKVTKEFYTSIANWYFWAIKHSRFTDDAEKLDNGRNMAIIRLITRIIFIWFMKVRGLIPDELFDEEKIKENLVDVSAKESTYYKAILQNLFFATLSTKQQERTFRSETRGHKGYNPDYGNHHVYRYQRLFKHPEALEQYFSKIPFLNGGLFECLDYKSKTNQNRIYIDGFTDLMSYQPYVPNFLFFSGEKEVDLNKEFGTEEKSYKVRGLLDILSSYNFTIDENSPDDAEVALDPELLGIVFENLLASYNPETATTARKATGSYYTPRPIVDYMVTQSLIQYFKTNLSEEVADIDANLSKLLSNDHGENPFNEAITNKMIEFIEQLRVVDPAVGSGAFPMSMLNKLVLFLSKLDPDNTLWKQRQIDALKQNIKDPVLQSKLIEQVEKQFRDKNADYGRKLYLIEKCIYGVDIQQIAVEIAKLRFFISLLVDEKIDPDKPNYGIEPLPNLDFKLMQGNSLIASFADIDFDKLITLQTQQATIRFENRYNQLISQFEEVKNQYQNEPNKDTKDKLREQIEDLLIKIFEEKLKIHFPQLKAVQEKAESLATEKQRTAYIASEKNNLSKKLGFDFEQIEKELLAYTEGKKPKDFFLWNIYFAEVFKEKGGFDIVIANPPYGVKLTIDKKKRLDNKFDWNSTTKNTAIYFIYAANSICHKNGINSFIVPKSLCYSAGWNKCAAFLLPELKNLIDSGKAFENVKLEQVIFLKQKASHHAFYTTGLFDGNNVLEFVKVSKDLFLKYKILLAGQHTEELKLINKIIDNNYCEFGQYVEIARGLNWQNKVKRFPGKTPIYRGELLDKYYIHKAIDFIDLNNFNSLEYEYQLKPKILNQLAIAHVKNPYPHFYLQAAMDLNKQIVFETISCTFIKNSQINIKFLLAINNSKLFAWLLYKFIYSTAIRSTRYDFQYVGRVPVPNLDDVNEQPLISLVDKILSITKDIDYLRNPDKQTKVKELEKEIDRLVYQLYNLTPEEIEIVEGKS